MQTSRYLLLTAALLICLTSVLKAGTAGPAAVTPLSTTQIAALALPAVVSVTVRDRTGEVLKTGSGFVVQHDVVATNMHVVADAHEVTVNFIDGRSVSSPGLIEARVRYDLALIYCDTGSVRPLRLDDAARVSIGGSVVAIGSPDGLDGTVTSGIVSGLRELPSLGSPRVIQTSAAISHGSSGGPLLNQYGEVIGMNSFGDLGGESLNFAYSADYIQDIINDSFFVQRMAFARVGFINYDWEVYPVNICLNGKWDKMGEGYYDLLAYRDDMTAQVAENDLDYGLPINAKDTESGCTILDSIAESGSPDCLKYLIENGADVESKSVDNVTPLMIAASYSKYPGIITTLIKAGARVDDQSNKGWTALMMAARWAPADTVKALIDNGASVNLTDNKQKTALMFDAENYGNVKITQYLISAGALLELKDADGWTALAHAAAGSYVNTTCDGVLHPKSNTDCVRALIAAGANLNATDNNMCTVLMDCVANADNADTVHMLISGGATVSAVNKNGWTALMYAADNGHTASIDALIAAGADTGAKNRDGATALMLTARDNHADAVTTLIADKADINASDNTGTTALMYAAYNGNTDCVNALIAAGANLNATDGSGQTALSYTKSGNNGKGYPDVAAALKAAGETQ